MIPLSDRTRRQWTYRLYWLLGVLPLVCVILGCLWLRYGPTAVVMSRTWSWKLGAEVTIAEVITPRPGVTRLTHVVVRSRETGQTLATIPQLEISRISSANSADPSSRSPNGNAASANANTIHPADSKNTAALTNVALTNVVSTESQSAPVYRLELTEPTLTLNGREEMLRILEQALITRCGEPAIHVQWVSDTLTAQQVASNGQTSAIRLRNLHGSLVGGDSRETLHSLAEVFFTLEDPVAPPAEVLPAEWNEKSTFDLAVHQEIPSSARNMSRNTSPSTPKNVTFDTSSVPTDGTNRSNDTTDATDTAFATVSSSPEIRLWMERYPAMERSLLRTESSATSGTTNETVRTFCGLDTGASSIPAQYLTLMDTSVLPLGASAIFRGRVFGRLDGQMLRMEAIEVVHCDPTLMIRQMQSPHWLEADGTLRGFDAQWNHGQIEWANGTFYAENGVISGSFVQEAASRLRCPTVFSNGVQPPDVAFSRLAFRFELQNDGIQLYSLDHLPEMLFSDPKGNLFPVILVDRQEKPVLGQPKSTEQPVSLSMFVQAMLPPPASQEKTVVTAYRGKYEQLLRKLPSGPRTEESQNAPTQIADARREGR